MTNMESEDKVKRFAELVALGAIQAAALFIAIKYAYDLTVTHYKEDGWLASVIIESIVTIATIIGAIAAVGALSFWKSNNGVDYSVKLASNIRHKYLIRFETPNIVPRTISILATSFWLLYHFDKEPSWLLLLVLPIWSFFLLELIIYSLHVVPVICLYVFTQDESVRRLIFKSF